MGTFEVRIRVTLTRFQGRIILVEDATTTWAKGGFEAQTVHEVNIASLADEFAEIRSTAEVLELLKQGT